MLYQKNNIIKYNAMYLWPVLLVCGYVHSFPTSTRERQSDAPVHQQRSRHRDTRHRQTDGILQHLDDYEIVTPALVDHNGNILSYDVTHNYHKRQRKRRSTLFSLDAGPGGDDRWIFYKLSAYGRDFHFNLSLNTKLVSPGYVREYWGSSGERRPSRDRDWYCHYIGSISNSIFSRVAISNCFGLLGNFATEAEEFLVEPLPGEPSSTAQGMPGRRHVVYRRSSIRTKYNDSTCGLTEPTGYHPHWWLSMTSHIQNDVLKVPYRSEGVKGKWRGRVRRHRRSVSVQHHVETLVVADQRMVQYHGRQHVEPYVLTLLNIVGNLYQEASLGNAVNIVVTRLILLTEDQEDLSIIHDADKSLEAFCSWQAGISKDATDGNTFGSHDNAILLTRLDICTYKSEPCGTLGLAPVAGMCDPERSCSIIEDIGLASAFTVAHELGHSFGMQHDGAGNECGTPGYEPAKLMAAELSQTEEPFSWSACSQHYITAFLDSGRGHCLLNEPQSPDLVLPNKLPGQLHDADMQCRFQYGPDSQQCKFTDVCGALWCLREDGECETNGIPAADGTACATQETTDGWCYVGQCRSSEWAPVSTAGGWTAWSGWGTCTRTCGGGIEASQRFCLDPRPLHGGQYCLGERKRYRSCNIHDCPRNATDFREVQCQRYDVVPFRGKLYKWQPYTGPGQLNPCALNCLAIGFNFYTERSPKAIDGTRCRPDSRNMCINGKCMHVGCNGILGSDAEEDKCRVCAGDGSTCHTMQGMFRDSLQGHEDSYQEVVRIPQGAVHIRIEETVPSRNYLALKSTSGDYYINGAWTIDWPWKFGIASTVFHYERPKDEPESLSAVGPTSQELVVMILLQERNLGVTYQYNVVEALSPDNSTAYAWQYKEWTQCSRTCATGRSTSVAVCIQLNDEKIVESDLCNSKPKPEDSVRLCSTQPCPPEWKRGAWTECTATCGGGNQTRNVTCIRRIDSTKSEVLTNGQCGGKEPRTHRACNNMTCPTHWEAEDWSECIPKCGPGLQTRAVQCVSLEGARLADNSCDEDTRPDRSRHCNQGPCPEAAWIIGAWGECSSKCGPGQQMRSIGCRDIFGEPSNECSLTTMPNNVQECEGACVLDAKIIACEDVNKVAYCPLVLKFQFCNRAYFRQMCCRTCRNAGL